ncbi:MFS transporter [Aquibacillus koreensis]|uniref:MFS transporter n=1 Tax=Aquibacillus koreensis TaxID=279446 RepID=A0A9X3WLM5_9BACI|nr:MFS transporter [Aquibacillus koreensis]MCT2534765.1 MFS transporter [Aquibacillus koreensis]MDC3419624.1 MFS transporter [Aquibacillus koreensis]
MNRLLTNKRFLALFLGRIITNIGDSLYYVASMWLVHEIGNNPFYTGLAGFLILLPKALQFLTGPFIDKWKIRRTLITTQCLEAVLVLIIPLAYFLNVLSVELILVVMPIIAFIEEFAYPTQIKALPLLLKKEDLMKGNSLFAFAYQGVDLVFNAISGIIVAVFGAITIFIIDSFTFALAAMLFALVKVSTKNKTENKSEKGLSVAISEYFKDLGEGIKVVFDSLFWALLVGSLLTNFAIGITMAILPTFAEQLGGARMYGILLTALSAGSLTGALLGSFLGRRNIGRTTIICFTLGALSWSSAGFVASPIFTSLLFGLAWIPIGAVNVLFAGISQSIIPNRLLGRVNSVMYSGSAISMPIGSLLGGYLATVVRSQTIFIFAGVGALFIAIIWIIHPKLRQLPQADKINTDTFGIRIIEREGCNPSEKCSSSN